MSPFPRVASILVSAALAAQAQAYGFSPEKATDAYLASMPPAAKAKSDAYWNGGYWIKLLDLGVTLAIAWLLLGTGLSRRLRELAERLFKRKPLQTFFYVLQYFAVTFVLYFPFTYFVDFVREHRYGLSHQPFGQWLGEQFLDLAVSAVLLSLLLIPLYGLIRRKAKTWWLWGSGVFILFLAFVLLIAPVFIDPLPPRLRRRFDGLLALSTLFAEAGEFPSSLPALLGAAAPTRASQEAALAATLRRMMRARQYGASVAA